MQRKPGQPAHVWTKERRRKQSRAIKAGLAGRNGNVSDLDVANAVARPKKPDPVAQDGEDLIGCFYSALSSEDPGVVACIRRCGFTGTIEQAMGAISRFRHTSILAPRTTPRYQDPESRRFMDGKGPLS